MNNNPVAALLQPLISNYSYPTTTTLYYSLQRSRSSSIRSYFKQNPRLLILLRFKSCSPIRSNSIDESTTSAAADVVKSDYKPGILDHLFLTLFRNKMVEEVGWDSDKPGYQGLIEVVNRLMMMKNNQNNSETQKAAVRILRSLFPPLLLQLYKMLVAPLGKGQVAAVMVAKVTELSCQWLMGRCTMNSVDLPDGSSWGSGVLVERCKYLEESKCVGICINTCKMPTQTFFKDYMGVPLVMEPNFTDYSCQFKFGVLPPIPLEDRTLTEPCLEICPNAMGCKKPGNNAIFVQCPKFKFGVLPPIPLEDRTLTEPCLEICPNAMGYNFTT